MTESKLIVKIDGDKLVVGYRIANVPLQPDHGIPNTIKDKKTTTQNEYEMTFSISKKIRTALKEMIRKKRTKGIISFGNFKIGFVNQAITLVVKTHIPMNQIKYKGDRYTVVIQESSLFHLKIQFRESFYLALRQVNPPTTPSANEERKTEIKQETVPAARPKNQIKTAGKLKETKKSKQAKVRRSSSKGNLMWAPDGTLAKRVQQNSKPSLPQIYHSNSSHRNCAKCQNLNSGNICAIHRIRVADHDACSRFYRFSIVLGGGVNPR